MDESVLDEGWKLLFEEAEAVELGEKTGILEKGRWTDLIVIDGDPLELASSMTTGDQAHHERRWLKQFKK